MWATHLSGQEHQTSPPSLPPSINPTPTLFQKELQAAAWQWLTLKPDLSYHIYRRYYHLTIVRKVRDPNVTHQAPFSRHVQCLVLSHISSLKILCKPSSTIQTTVLGLLWILDLSWWQFHLLEGTGSIGGQLDLILNNKELGRKWQYHVGVFFTPRRWENRSDLHLSLVDLPRPEIFQMFFPSNFLDVPWQHSYHNVLSTTQNET